MDQDRTPQELARDAADTIQALNNATQTPTAFYGEHGAVYAAPAAVSDVIQGLLELAGRLPQALEQSARVLQHLEEQRQIRIDDGSDVSDMVSKALRPMLDAQQAFQVAHVHLREAGAALSKMGGHFVDEVEDESAAV